MKGNYKNKEVVREMKENNKIRRNKKMHESKKS